MAEPRAAFTFFHVLWLTGALLSAFVTYFELRSLLWALHGSEKIRIWRGGVSGYEKPSIDTTGTFSSNSTLGREQNWAV